ncbi:MAG: hypothetical protein NC095_01890 [Muribaculum sp.]|nr:hypothetical protein [Muribaculum sp.]
MDIHQRKLIRIAIFIIIAIIALTYELFRLWKRRKKRSEATALGQDEYLKYLKTEYQELKFRYDTSTSYKEQEKWLREMKDVEQKIILTERDIEKQSTI